VLTSSQPQGVEKPQKLCDLSVDLASATRHKRSSTTLPTIDLFVEMLEKAERYLIITCQEETFKKERDSLKRHGKCTNNSNLISLRPFLDEYLSSNEVKRSVVIKYNN